MTDLPEPTWRLLLSRGLPTLALEGILPVLVFYAVLHASSLPAAIVASSLTAGAACSSGAARTSRSRRSRSSSSSCRRSSASPTTAPRSISPSPSWSAPALRLGALLASGIGGLVVVSLAVGVPGQIALAGWCLWHPRRALTDDAQMSSSARRLTHPVRAA